MDQKSILYFVWYLVSLFNVSLLQVCPDGNEKIFMKASLITTQDLQTCSNVVDVMTSVTSFLETCQFTSSADAPTFAHCSSRCKLQNDCFALTYSTTNGCELCMDTAGAPGNGNTYDVSKVMLNIPALGEHINGRKLLDVEHVCLPLEFRHLIHKTFL